MCMSRVDACVVNESKIFNSVFIVCFVLLSIKLCWFCVLIAYYQSMLVYFNCIYTHACVFRCSYVPKKMKKKWPNSSSQLVCGTLQFRMGPVKSAFNFEMCNVFAPKNPKTLLKYDTISKMWKFSVELYKNLKHAAIFKLFDLRIERKKQLYSFRFMISVKLLIIFQFLNNVWIRIAN